MFEMSATLQTTLEDTRLKLASTDLAITVCEATQLDVIHAQQQLYD